MPTIRARLRALARSRIARIATLTGAGAYFLALAYHVTQPTGRIRGYEPHSLAGKAGEPILIAIGVALLAAALVIALRRD